MNKDFNKMSIDELKQEICNQINTLDETATENLYHIIKNFSKGEDGICDFKINAYSYAKKSGATSESEIEQLIDKIVENNQYEHATDRYETACMYFMLEEMNK